MFGTPESTCKSFSDTWEILPFSNDDEGEEEALEQGKVLSSEELIERLQYINNIFSSEQSGRGYSPEAFALLCTLLTCASWCKENRALFNSLSTLLDNENSVVDTISDNVATQCCEHEREYDDVFIFENARDYRVFYFETVYCANDVDYYKEVLPVNTLSRGPPERGYDCFADSKYESMLIDIAGVYSAPVPDKDEDSHNNCLQYDLPINSLQYQVNGGGFHETA
jgi:hypothetical protein